MTDNKPPQPPISRGMLLGLPIFLALLFSAFVVYLIAGALGWTGSGRALIALCGGPILGFILIGMFWVMFKPKLS